MPYLQTLPAPYCGDVKAAKVRFEQKPSINLSKAKVDQQHLSIVALQHPLSVYQQILEAL